MGYGDVFKDTPRLALTLRGIKKASTQPKRIRLPITTDLMYTIHRTLAAGVFGFFTDVLCFAAMNLAFFGGLRCSEFTVPDSFDPNVHLCRGDITFNFDQDIQREYISVTLKCSKTDPFREGVTLLIYATGQSVCAVTALKIYLSVTGVANGSSPLFRQLDGQPLSRRAFVGFLHAILQKANINSTLYNGHSFRKGMATSAANSGVEDSLICTLGRWKSHSYKLYISTPKSAIAAAQLAISNQASNT